MNQPHIIPTGFVFVGVWKFTNISSQRDAAHAASKPRSGEIIITGPNEESREPRSGDTLTEQTYDQKFVSLFQSSG